MKEIGDQIDEIRGKMGESLLILGHHYQRQSVLRHADEKGDSLELSRMAGEHPEVEKIVFCGVRFMAESADILTDSNQEVYMPESSAGCPMANMADATDMRAAWDVITQGTDDWLPVVYVNSTAEVKAICGELGGSTCTSSNAAEVFKWVFDQGKRVFFLPEEHLGANTSHDLGIPDDEVAVWDPSAPLDQDQIAHAKVIVWKGFCLVHVAFTTEHVQSVRTHLPDARIIVHPESPKEVVRLCDAHGSTSQIIKYVASAEEGSTIVIGTELNLVQRLADEYEGKLSIKALAPSVCANMAKINEQNLLDVLQSWPESRKMNVPADVIDGSRSALQRMLEL
jgi:quinolinate synthase